MTRHTEQCNLYFDIHQKQVKDFYEAHPNTCRTCRGFGFIDNPDPYGAKTIDCPDCTAKERCPSCRSHTEYGCCSECGFSESSDPMILIFRVAPPPFVCVCGRKEYELYSD